MAKQAALITGASKRIGRDIALTLAQNGYDIALHYNHGEKEAKQLQKEITQLGVRCEVFQYDLRQTAGIEAWFGRVAEAMPHLNVLINNASVFKRKRFHESDLELFETQMAINATAPILLTKAFASTIKSGHVINMLDTDIVKNHGSHFAYLLSKKTLASFTKMVARELAPHIQVNGICPGVILESDEIPEGYREKLPERLPMAELSTEADICRSIVWLLNQPRITGQFIFNDSGQHLL